MDGSTFTEAPVYAGDDPRHPHQLWVAAKPDDLQANICAFQAARPGITTKFCCKVFRLHDSAQHHFITMLLWDRPEGGYMSISEAYIQAQKHHQEVTGMVSKLAEVAIALDVHEPVDVITEPQVRQWLYTQMGHKSWSDMLEPLRQLFPASIKTGMSEEFQTLRGKCGCELIESLTRYILYETIWAAEAWEYGCE